MSAGRDRGVALARAATWSLPLLLTGATLAVGIADPRPADLSARHVAEIASYVGALLGPFVVGVVLTWRVPHLGAGWSFCGLAVVVAWSAFADTYALAGLEGALDLPGGEVLAPFGDSSWLWWFAALVLCLHHTATAGRSSGWVARWLTPATLTSSVVAQVGSLLRTTELSAYRDGLVSPLAVPALDPVARPVTSVAMVVVGLCLIVAVLELWSTFRRSHGEDRQRLLWLVAGALPLAPGVVACFAVSYAGYDVVAGPIIGACVITLSLGAGLSVLRYRLYDVERVVTDSSAYALSSGAVLAAFGAVVLVLTRTLPVGATSPVATVLGTLAAAAVARPAYVWARESVDRRFNRRRFDAVRRVQTALSGASPDVEQALRDALGDPSAGLVFAAGDQWVDASGVVADPGPHVVPIRRHGAVTARLGFDPHATDLAVATAVVAAAAVEIDNLGLRAALARQVEEVSESRTRLASAHLDERRRIERDLHDGAQQHLLAIALQLQSAQLNGDERVLRDEVERAVTQLGVTVQELRTLAAGMQPAALAGGGLRAAAEELASRVPLDVEVDVTPTRFPPAVESAAWFVVAEGVANAIKHSGAGRATISGRVDGDHLVVAVEDTGGGGADPRGSGLQNLADRVAALGGRLSVTAGAEGGDAARGGVPVRVVIADDSALLREGLARLLAESGVEVAAVAADARELEVAVRETRPDVAVVDIRMPPTFTHEGAEAALGLREELPELGVLLLSQAVETHFATQLLDRHAQRFGYLLKDRVIQVTTLVDALHTIAGGGTVLDPEIVRHLMGRRRDPLAVLSDRERDVLALMAEGRSNTAVADRLAVSVKTVESHIASIFTKLDLHGTPDDHRRVLAVLAALRSGD